MRWPIIQLLEKTIIAVCVAQLEVRVPVSEVAHGVGCVGQAWMDSCVGWLGITGAPRHFFFLPSLKAGCFGVQISLCEFTETQITL